MKLKFFIIFLFIGIATHLRAQTAVLASHAVSYASEIPCVSHYINIKCSPLQSINVQIIYFRNNEAIDSIHATFITQANEVYGNYWQKKIEHPLNYGNYTYQITAENLSNNQYYQAEKVITIKDTNTLHFTDITLFAMDSTKPLSTALIENFVDSNIQSLQLQSQIVHPELITTDIILYCRITKKGKPNHILFSKTDSISFINFIKCKHVFPYQIYIPLDNFVTGNYVIQLGMYQKDKEITNTSTNWQCIRPIINLAPIKIVSIDNFSDAILHIENTFVGKYNITTLRRNILSLQPIITNSQFRNIQQMVDANDDTLMRRYFYNFWKTKNNAQPEAAWKEYSTKLNHCINHLGGVVTDKSLIYLRYGPADKTEEVPNEPNTIPYEIWQYETIGEFNNVIFLFIQGKGMGEQKQLLHCSAPIEKQYLRWHSFLIRGEDNNNRVLEYLQENGNSK